MIGAVILSVRKSLSPSSILLILLLTLVMEAASPYTPPSTLPGSSRSTPTTSSAVKVAVTGANGYVASELVKQLLLRGKCWGIVEE